MFSVFKFHLKPGKFIEITGQPIPIILRYQKSHSFLALTLAAWC
jgi:hypothetical protein